MSKYKVGFESLNTGSITWFTNADGEIAEFTRQEALSEVENQNKGLQDAANKRARHGNPHTKGRVNTLCIMMPLEAKVDIAA